MKKISRSCPECNNLIWYSTNKSKILSEKNKTLCSTCCRKGNKNPFFGKTHTANTIKKMKNKNMSYMKTSKYIKKYKKSLLTRHTNKISMYDCWIKNYGIEIANKKLKDFRVKISKATTGKNNPMYGKPSPQGSGNGWSGWYKGWRFRSLKELSYVINYLEKNNIKWESAESKKYMIPYIDYKGTKRNYFPDFFLIDEKCLVECKPKNLFNSLETNIKKIAAEVYCKNNGLSFKLVDPGKLDNTVIANLHSTGEIKFIKKYEEKWHKNNTKVRILLHT